MSETNTNVAKQFLDKDGLNALWDKICQTFVGNTKQASDDELGLIKALENTDVQLNELQGHDSDGNNYPVQIISDGTAFVNMPKPETITVVDEKVKNEVITDTTTPYFLLGQSSQNITSKAGTDVNCYIKEGSIYSSCNKVLTEANLEDNEPVQRNDNTWSNVKLDTDGFMGVDVPTIPTSLKNPYSLTIQGNGTTLTNGVYDGSAAKTVNITPASIGAASVDDIPIIPESLKNPNSLTIQANGTTIGTYDGSSAITANITASDIGAAIAGDVTSSNGGHTHTVNATTSTTEVAAKTHNHTVTATGNVSSSFTGTQTNTGNNTSGATVASSGHTHDISGSITVSGQRDTTNLRMFNVSFSFSGSSSATTSTTEVAAKTHNHTVTATGNVSSSFTGTQTTTGNNTSGTTVASSGHTHTTSNDGSHSHTI